MNSCNQRRAEPRKLPLDDKTALSVFKRSLKFDGAPFEVALPWKRAPYRPGNRLMAVSRLNNLVSYLTKHPKLKLKYCEAMEDYYSDVHAIPLCDFRGHSDEVWYPPPHAVLRPMKSDKFKVVLDCAAQFPNDSLNGSL
ncbi:unnamed protein product, partial [Echinostoma caproni]|uniref:PORR domain-containing protein n=1 Tax=Echinostoma caproni TaxID=27848 RepID=A0A183BF18_9TREM